ncbi:MAG: type 2 lanthipeptide synthetase LanM [Rhodospirillales bacterium]|nr:type 2 lanthipeptide synthetase LanM [Rhodospirillales bacterium]
MPETGEMTTDGDKIDWAALSATAATIDERLGGGMVATGTPGCEAAADGNLVLWRESSAFGDPARFERRLARDGLSLDDVRPLMGPVRWRDDHYVPDWVETARRILDGVLRGVDFAGARMPAELADEIPFAGLMWPAVQVARARRDAMLGDIAPAIAELVNDAALTDLDTALLRRLAEIYGPTLNESFKFFRLAGAQPLADAPAGRGVHAAFVAAMRSGAFTNLIRHRPVMIRLLSVVSDQWVGAGAEMLRRLAVDRSSFADRLQGVSRSAAVTGFDVAVSDPHDHGRGVAVLRFADGGRLVYKPRDLAMEKAWHGLAAWLARSGSPIGLGAAGIWCRAGYGWMEFVEADSDIASDETGAFFRRVGGLLAVMRWLRASDMHEENIVVRDAIPVPIDLETVLQPNLMLERMKDLPLIAEAAAQEALDNSVLCVGLLPRRMRVAGREAEVGGLAPPEVFRVAEWRFTNVGRDDMEEKKLEVERSAAGLVLTTAGEPLLIADHAPSVAAGFRDMVMFLAAHRHALFSKDGPLAAFEECRVRHVLRATAYYEILRREACRPANQANGIAWSRHFERLTRNMRWDLEPDPGWPVVAGERAALARYDIPLLLGKAAMTGCWIDGEPVAPGLFQPAIWPQLRERWETLAASLGEETRILVQAATSSVFPVRRRRPWSDDSTELSEADGRALALSIAELIAERAVRRGDAAAWIGLGLSADGKGFDLKPLDAGLYGGQAGIAFFLAACFRATADAQWRSLALEALAAIQFRLARPELAAEMVRQIGIGGIGGVGSLVYVFTQLAEFLEAPALLEDAKRAAALIDGSAIANDHVLDIVGGAAGAALGLLALHEATGENWILDRAADCGRRIPARPRAGTADWRGLFPRPLTGFSHGAAGIAYALMKLHAAVGDARFLDTARRGLDYERSLFNAEHGNWPDLRTAEGVSFPCQWCHGAAGIGLARLSALDVVDDGDMREEIAAALSVVAGWPDADPDHLCCGNAGRLMILDAGGRILGRPDLRALARRRAAAWLRRAGGVEGFVLPGSDPAFRLGFFQGLAGVGYALLWLGNLEGLPNPLVLGSSPRAL